MVLCWNLPDYLDESLVKPVVGRLWSVLKPGGMLLAFFHTRDAGPDSPCHRFHIVGTDTLEMQKIVLRREARRGPTGAVHTAISDGFQLQRVFNNRHIENSFPRFRFHQIFSGPGQCERSAGRPLVGFVFPNQIVLQKITPMR